jgi:hypothetical protein
VLRRFIMDLGFVAQGFTPFGRFTRMSENPQCNEGLRRNSVNTQLDGLPFVCLGFILLSLQLLLPLCRIPAQLSQYIDRRIFFCACCPLPSLELLLPVV